VLRSPRHPYTRELVAARSRMARGQPHPVGERVLEVRGLAVSYPGQGLFAAPRFAVRGLDLTLARGEALCLLGASGSGKSSVARALLVCDEVLSALDACVQAEVLDLLQGLRRERRLALLFITHDLRVARHLGGRVAVMAEGRIVEEGPATQVFADPRHAVTRELLAAEMPLPA